MKNEELIKELKNNVQKEKRALQELTILYKQYVKLKSFSEKRMMASQVKELRKNLHEANERAFKNVKTIYLPKPLPKIEDKKEAPIKKENKEKSLTKEEKEVKNKIPSFVPSIKEPQSFNAQNVYEPTGEDPNKEKYTLLDKEKFAEEKREPGTKKEIIPKKRKKLIKRSKDLKLEGLEKATLKRLMQREKKVVKKKEKKPNKFAKRANKMFGKTSIKMLEKKTFRSMERDLIKANMQYTPTTYISIIFYSTFLSFFAGILIAAFFLFFKITATLPIVNLITEDIFGRFLKTFWIIIVVPIITFVIMYFYPLLEKKSTAHKIDHELPFATINMAAISGSLIDPSKIFNIIIATKEYPYLSKEFTKILNEINIHGYNFVGALRNASFNCPSKKLSELLSGLATTINSGGDLPNFFDERSKSLLFDHRLEKERQAKTAETFMDIYISLVVAAPMILMLLLIMMQISGLGVGFSTNTITVIMVLAVSVINILFLTFLEVKKD